VYVAAGVSRHLLEGYCAVHHGVDHVKKKVPTGELPLPTQPLMLQPEGERRWGGRLPVVLLRCLRLLMWYVFIPPLGPNFHVIIFLRSVLYG
jgi:hypothetical protein